MTPPPLSAHEEARIRTLAEQEVERFLRCLLDELAPLPAGTPLTYRTIERAREAYRPPRGETP